MNDDKLFETQSRHMMAQWKSETSLCDKNRNLKLLCAYD